MEAHSCATLRFCHVPKKPASNTTPPNIVASVLRASLTRSNRSLGSRPCTSATCHCGTFHRTTRATSPITTKPKGRNQSAERYVSLTSPLRNESAYGLAMPLGRKELSGQLHRRPTEPVFCELVFPRKVASFRQNQSGWVVFYDVQKCARENPATGQAIPAPTTE